MKEVKEAQKPSLMLPTSGHNVALILTIKANIWGFFFPHLSQGVVEVVLSIIWPILESHEYLCLTVRSLANFFRTLKGSLNLKTVWKLKPEF